MYKISKEFDFCYGHRVWSQTLDKNFSLDECLVCRHLHGHQGKIIAQAKSNNLEKGMVTDFKHFNWLKEFIDNVVDHKFILDKNDPLFSVLLPLGYKNLIKKEEEYWVIDLKKLQSKTKEIIEMYEGFIIVDFVPTSENLSKWFFEIVQKKMKPLNITIDSISFFETPKTKSIYEE